jgi:GNAT superfamily N-acetyltransferase
VTPSGLRVEPLAAPHLAGWRALFDACACACFCRYWHFTGDKNAWLDRAAHRPEESLAEQEADLAAGDPRAAGVVALDGDAIVGWMKIAPRSVMGKLRSLPVYRAADLGDGEGVWSIGCFLVAPSHRGAGVARALLEGGAAFARAQGAVTLEAYPRRSADALGEHEVWQGPLHLFASAGFEVYAEAHPPYPVLRRPA